MLKQIFRPRLWGVWVIAVAVIGWLFATDPDRGAATRDMLQNLAAVWIAVVAAHFVRKTLFDYINLKEHAESAGRGNVGSGLVVLAVVLFTAVCALLFSSRAHAADVKTYVPAGAVHYCPVLLEQQGQMWPAHPDPAALCALVEQESCTSLTSAKCWSPVSRLKTDREEGAGFGQITRAFNPDGSIRFDALAAARSLDDGLAGWSWANVYQRPDLQLRAIVAMNRDCARRLSQLVSDPAQVLRFCDAAYNGGYGGMMQERRACAQRAGCDPQVWFGNVSEVCLKSKTRWKGYGQSACDINRGHVHYVFNVRHDKYQRFVPEAQHARVD